MECLLRKPTLSVGPCLFRRVRERGFSEARALFENQPPTNPASMMGERLEGSGAKHASVTPAPRTQDSCARLAAGVCDVQRFRTGG